MVAVPNDDVDGDDFGRSRVAPFPSSDSPCRPWLRFLGPGRLLGAPEPSSCSPGVAWWMLRPRSLRPKQLPLPPRRGRQVASAIRRVRSPVDGAADDRPCIVVHVTGAVRAPGVYELQPGRRVADAIDAAGGALADADADALNLAAPLADGDRIAVPTVGESGLAGDVSLATLTLTAPPAVQSRIAGQRQHGGSRRP